MIVHVILPVLDLALRFPPITRADGYHSEKC